MKLFKPFKPVQAANRLDGYFQKVIAKNPGLPLQARFFSPKHGLDFTFPAGSADQPYHVASIGKLFTAALVYRLAESGLLSPADPIRRYCSDWLLENLFVYQGIDYAGQATIAQLLDHTSGLADYIEGDVTGARPFLEQLLSDPDTLWTPQSLLDFSRQHQRAVAAPGQVFNYSDTGYILLGLIVETVTGKSFSDNLHEHFFRPLGMADSYLMFYGKPANTSQKTLEKIWFNGIEISTFESLSCDWAGGGIVSTTADLLKFNLALRDGRLLPPQALAAMERCTHKFQRGIYYGSGMMEIRFGEFFFLLGRLPKVRGHIGILATHLFYDPIHDAHVVLNFGSNQRMVESFRALIELESLLQKL